MEMPTLFDTLPATPVLASRPRPQGPLHLRQQAKTSPAWPLVPGSGDHLPPRHRRTLLAVDGNALVHRAFHAYGTDALYGVLALLAGIAGKAPFDGVVVGFDDTTASWRRSRWPSYKAQRPPKPPALITLLDQVPVVLTELGLSVVTADGHEADDVLGSAAAAATASGWCSVLATSDRDAYALVDDDTTVLRLRSGLDNALAVTPRVIRSLIGVDPGQYVGFAALRGDPSDNLPGIPGIGRSRAKELLAAYPTIEAAVADEIGCLSVLGRDLGRLLIDDLAGRESIVRRNVELMTIRRDVVIDVGACAPRLPFDAVERSCFRLGLGAVAGRMAAAFGARPAAIPPPSGPQQGRSDIRFD